MTTNFVSWRDFQRFQGIIGGEFFIQNCDDTAYTGQITGFVYSEATAQPRIISVDPPVFYI